MDERVKEPKGDKDALFTRLRGWFKEDNEKSSEWRQQAKEDFAFVSGDQWSEADKQTLRDQMRPVITMNRIDPIIDSVSGSEVANRQEVRYIPREEGDAIPNEVLTSAAQWFRDQCDAEDEESDAFRDTLVCGMGWTETRLDYETEPDGDPVVDRVDPLEMVWDCQSRKRNLVDARRLFHIRRNIPIEEAKALVPGEFEDEDYNAVWVDSESNVEHTDEEAYDEDDKNTEGESTRDKKVTLVRAQWWERETVYRVPDPTNPQNALTLTKAELDDLTAKLEAVGIPQPKPVKATRRAYRQAYLGRKVLDEGEAPCKEHFSFNCITGKRDRNEGTWYGLVRGMKDPQRWANKWLSQSLHMLNSSAKGGVMAERGAFDNDVDAEKSWAKNDAITWTKNGAVSAGKIQPKPTTPMPAGFFQLMQLAFDMIPHTSGVSVELLGMRESQQAASLEYQRRQSSMTILQPMFDSLRRYRKVQGRQMLYLIQHYLSDGRLIRIVGNEQEKYVPLVRQPDSAKYDIIVDDAPTSPNQKEQTWEMLQQILPAVGKILPPQTWIALLDYSPLPTSAQKKIKDSIQPKGPDGQPLPPPPDPEVVKAEMEIELAQKKAAAEQQLKQQQQQFDMEIGVAKAQQEAELEKIKMANTIELERAKMQNEMMISRERAASEQAMAHEQLQHQTVIDSAKADNAMKIERKRAAQKPARK